MAINFLLLYFDKLISQSVIKNKPIGLYFWKFYLLINDQIWFYDWGNFKFSCLDLYPNSAAVQDVNPILILKKIHILILTRVHIILTLILNRNPYYFNDKDVYYSIKFFKNYCFNNGAVCFFSFTKMFTWNPLKCPYFYFGCPY